MSIDHLSKLIRDRVYSWLVFRCSTARDRARLFAAWNLITNWSGYFGQLASKLKLDDATVIDRVDKWALWLLAFAKYQSPHVLGVKLRKFMMGAT